MAPRYNLCGRVWVHGKKMLCGMAATKPCATTTMIVDAWSSNGVREEASQLSRGFGSHSMQARGS
jgi:hypothetical protein